MDSWQEWVSEWIQESSEIVNRRGRHIIILDAGSGPAW